MEYKIYYPLIKEVAIAPDGKQVVKGVKTPTLILHGEEDKRVPLVQGKELYNALKRQGVTTEMIIYPRQEHRFTDPRFILDLRQRILDWFDRFVLAK